MADLSFLPDQPKANLSFLPDQPGKVDTSFLPDQKAKSSFDKGVMEVIPNVAAGVVKTATGLATAGPWLAASSLTPTGQAARAFFPKQTDAFANKMAGLADQAGALIPGQTPPEIMAYEGLNPLEWKNPVRKLSALSAQNLPGMFIGGAITKGMGVADKTYKLFKLGKFPVEVTRSGLMGSLVLAPQVGQSFYKEAVDNGMDPNIAAPAALIDTAFSTVTEGMALKGIVSETGPWLKRIAMGALQEGLIEEGVQSSFENLLKIVGWKDSKPVAERFFAGTMEGVLTGGILGGATGAVFGTNPTKEMVQRIRDAGNAVIEQAGVEQGKSAEEIKEMKRAGEGTIQKIIKESLFSKKRYQEFFGKHLEKELVDIVDTTKGYSVTNQEDVNGKVREIKVNAEAKVSVESKTRASEVIKQVFPLVETAVGHEIDTPIQLRETIENEIALLLDGGMSDSAALEKTVQYLSNPKELKQLFLMAPIKSDEDLNAKIYALDTMTSMNFGAYLNQMFTQGLTPVDLEFKQLVKSGEKKEWTKHAREVAKRIYKEGLNKGYWQKPQAGPQPVPVAPAPIAPAETPLPASQPNQVETPTSVEPTPQILSDSDVEVIEQDKTSAQEVKAEPLQILPEPTDVLSLNTSGEKMSVSPFVSTRLDAMGNIPPHVGTPYEELIDDLYRQLDVLADKYVSLERKEEIKKELVEGVWLNPSQMTQIASDEVLKNELKALDDKYPGELVEFEQDYQETRRHIHNLIDGLMNQHQLSVDVKAAQEEIQDVEAETTERFAEEAVRAKTPSGEKGEVTPEVSDLIENKVRGETAALSDLKDLRDLLKDWKEILSPYVPEEYASHSGKSYLRKRETAQSIFSKKQSRNTFELLMAQAKELPEYKVANEYMLSEVKKLVSRMDVEQLKLIEERVGFHFSNLKENLGDLWNKFDSIMQDVDEVVAKEEAKATPWAPSEVIRAGGVEFTVDEPIEIQTDKGPVTISGKQVWDKSGLEKFSFELNGEEYVADISQLIDNPLVHFNWMEFYSGYPVLNIAGKALYSAITSIKNKIDPRKGNERQLRNRPLIEVLRWFRRDPNGLIMNWKYGKGMTEQKKLALEEHSVYGPASNNIKSLMFQDRLFTDAVKTIREEQLRQIMEEFNKIAEPRIKEELKNRKEELAQFGIVDKRTFIDQVLSKLLMRASEQVVVDEDYAKTGKYSESIKARSQHFDIDGNISAEEHKAFLIEASKFYQLLGYTPDPQQLVNWKDPNGVREPYAWELLGKWMGDDSLQKFLLFNKADDMALLNEELANGVHINTDIYTSIKLGYQRRVFEPTEAQRQEGFQNKYYKNATGSTKQPSRNVYSYENFIQSGAMEHWVPVDDYFTSYREYGISALTATHQALTLSNLKGETMVTFHKDKEFRTVGSDHLVLPVILYRHSPLILQELKKINKATGKEYSVEAVLESLGYIQGKSMPGLVEWHAGAFTPPYAFTPVNDMMNTMFDSWKLSGLARVATDVARIVKFIKTINPWDTVSTFGAAALLNVADVPYKIPMKLATFLPRVAGYSAKGLLYAKYMAKGEWDKIPRPASFNFPHVDLMITSGFQAISFNQAMQSYWDHAFVELPEMNTKRQNAKAIAESLFGINYALWNEMLANDLGQAWERMFQSYKAKGMTDWDAAYRTSNFLNNASFLLNRAIYNQEGSFLQMFAFSRGLFTGLMRSGMSLIYGVDQKFNLNIHKTGIFNYHTSKVGKMFNSFLNAEMTPADQKVLAAETWKYTVRMLVTSLVIKQLIQFCLSYRDDDEEDEHGEIGSQLGLAAKKRWIIFNKQGWFDKARLGEKDWNNKQLFGDFQLFRYTRDLAEITRGRFLSYLGKRENLLLSSMRAIIKNEDPTTGARIYNQQDEDTWRSLRRQLWFAVRQELPIGLEPMVGIEEGDVMGLKALGFMGTQISRGESWSGEKAEKSENSGRSFMEEQAASIIRFTPTKLLPTLKNREKNITPEKLRNEYNRRKNPKEFFRRQNRSIIRRNKFLTNP